MENLMYVAAANGGGTFEESTLLGRSAFHDPWGTTLASAGDGATIEPERVTERREAFPALGDRR